MPQIAPDIWKMAISFYWWRQYEDGRIEQEFDPLTGQIRLWGETPSGLKRAGWLPISYDLANKMQSYGEFGNPTQAPAIVVEIKPGEELEIFKDCSVINGYQVHCKACGAVYKSFGEPIDSCKMCGIRPAWRCPTCDKLSDEQICSSCHQAGRKINPLDVTSHSWEDVLYVIGIKGLYRLKFNANGLIAEH